MRRTSRLVVFITLLVVGLSTVGEGATADQAVIAASRDNTLYEDADGDTSNGAGDWMFCGRNAGGEARRAVMAFDVAASIPPGSTITSASLELVMSRTVAGDTICRLHRLLANWGEAGSDAPGNEGDGADAQPGDATWQHMFFETQFWQTDGGDFAPTSSAETVVSDTGTYVWTSATLATDVQLWLDDPAQNFGWILIGDEETAVSAKRFDTRDNPLPENQPRLIVEFTPPVGGPLCIESFVIHRGLVDGGTVEETCDSDDIDWTFRPDAVFATIVAPVNVSVEAIFTGPAPATLEFGLEGAATHNGVVLRLEVFNFAQNAWESRVFSNMATTDTTYSIVRAANAPDYIGPGGEVRARFSCLRPAGVPPLWRVGVDQAVWIIE